MVVFPWFRDNWTLQAWLDHERLGLCFVGRRKARVQMNLLTVVKVERSGIGPGEVVDSQHTVCLTSCMSSSYSAHWRYTDSKRACCVYFSSLAQNQQNQFAFCF